MINPLLIEEKLNGRNSSLEEIRTLFKIVGIDHNPFLTAFGFESGFPGVDVKLEEAVETGMCEWMGKGEVHADVMIINPTIKERARVTMGNVPSYLYQRQISIPVEFNPVFIGSDLNFSIAVSDVPEYDVQPASLMEDIQPIYDFIQHTLGQEALLRELNDTTAMLKINPDVAEAMYQLMLRDVNETVQQDPGVYEIVQDEYSRIEQRIPVGDLIRFYDDEIVLKKGLVQEKHIKNGIGIISGGRKGEEKISEAGLYLVTSNLQP